MGFTCTTPLFHTFGGFLNFPTLLSPCLPPSLLPPLPLKQQSLTFLAPETDFKENRFSMDWGGVMIWGWFKCITFIVTLFLLLLHQLHLRSSDLRSGRLGTPALKHPATSVQSGSWVGSILNSFPYCLECYCSESVLPTLTSIRLCLSLTFPAVI